MAKIVIIAPSDATEDVKDAVKLLKGQGHDVDTEEPTPKALIHIVLGLLGPNGYGFGPAYGHTPGPAADEDPDNDDAAADDTVEADPGAEEDVDLSGDDFNFESLGKVSVDGELIEAVPFDSDTSVLCVEKLQSGAKTTYSLNESLFSFWPADSAAPTQRVVIQVDKHRTSAEVPVVEAEDKATLKVGRDLIEMFKKQ